MATLILTTVGTLIGGPIGGGIGALIGRSIDGEIFGAGSREGPRLEELAVSTSTYGQAVGRHYGRMRTAGTVIWATDFKEQSETSGGKGKPKVTTYSYSVSFAVALASRPIEGLGRIWADGNLLRGAAGDLKSNGILRIYEGHGDQPVDPLLSAALGAQCPANRGMAYAVFEDLELADFGNRIPALTFEIFAGEASELASDLAIQTGATATLDAIPQGLEGFSHTNGTLLQVFDLLSEFHQLAPQQQILPLNIAPAGTSQAEPIMLPSAIAASESEFGERDGTQLTKRGTPRRATSVRYYDIDRDYQAGVQSSNGRASNVGERAVDFPAALSAANAQGLAQRVSLRRSAKAERMMWRIAELDPELGPGRLVRLPDTSGIWQIDAWEWRDTGIELELSRFQYPQAAQGGSDSGAVWTPPDRAAATTVLRAFELPWDGTGSSDTPQIYAAVSAGPGRWAGANLSLSQNGVLSEIAFAPAVKAVVGQTISDLPPSSALMLEGDAELLVELLDPEMLLTSTDVAGLAAGANRLLIGDEIVQFLNAEEQSAGQWRLSGLLRGRGGTEAIAQLNQSAGTAVTLLNGRVFDVPLTSFDPQTDQLAALGVGDEHPVLANFEGAGSTRKPLTPVHPRSSFDAQGAWQLCWTRRARGAWNWPDEVEAPLVEQAENYQIGIGPVSSPLIEWHSVEPLVSLDAAQVADISASYSGLDIWVRQTGSHARSDALRLAIVP